MSTSTCLASAIDLAKAQGVEAALLMFEELKPCQNLLEQLVAVERQISITTDSLATLSVRADELSERIATAIGAKTDEAA